MKKTIATLFLISFLFSCAQEKQNDIPIEEEKPFYSFETVVDGFDIPWGMTWLPDGSMLITEKKGELIHFKDGKKTTIENVPEVYARGQGGLLDIATHPNYEQNGWIYITYSSTEGDGDGGNTKLIRCKLKGNKLTQIEDLYKGMPNSTKGQHFGTRIVFDKEGHVYFSIGDRGSMEENPQDLTRDGGKLYRLNDDGSIPDDNPFTENNDAKKAIFSYGHRNIQGTAIHPETGEIWSHEHGPKGGDEINIHKKGANYGWPEITYGIDYDGSTISEKTEKAGMEQPIYYWTPSIAPSGMAFITGTNYPDWQGDLLVGSLKFQYLELVKLEGEKVVGRQKIATDIGRLRDVKMGPDGYIYMGVEGKGIVRIVPE